jgi:FixJ family two-component response regulator
MFIAKLNNEQLPDCILLDLYLPGINGVEVLRTLANRQVDTPVIVLTARPEGPLTAPAIMAGATEIMTIPVQPAALIDRIQKLIS